MKRVLTIAAILLAATPFATFAQNASSDEGGRVLGLEKLWNHAIEAKDTKALDQLLASTFVAVEIDGTISSKSEFLASIKAPEYQPSQAVNEDMVWSPTVRANSLSRIPEMCRYASPRLIPA